MGEGRIIRDALHGDIEISEDVRRIIDTRTFQRLRYIQQLATSHYAFPSATHTRFSHSLGAHHLATRLIGRLRELYPDAISDEDARLVPIAALLHDVGHPPFSHMFETPEVFATFRGHEEWGRLLMQDEECDLSGVLTELLGDSVDRLLAIMDGSVEPRFLSEIISSQLDVDRLDYLKRDQFGTGADVGSIDLDRILRSLRISDEGGLVVRRDRVEVVEGYLVTRWHMYQLVYFHKLNMLTQAYYVRSLARARHLHEHEDLRLSLRMRDMLSNRELTPLRYSQLTDAFVIADVFASPTRSCQDTPLDWPAAMDSTSGSGSPNTLLSRRRSCSTSCPCWFPKQDSMRNMTSSTHGCARRDTCRMWAESYSTTAATFSHHRR